MTEKGTGCHRPEAEAVAVSQRRLWEKAAHRICGLQRAQPHRINRVAGKELGEELSGSRP